MSALSWILMLWIQIGQALIKLSGDLELLASPGQQTKDDPAAVVIYS